MPRSKPSMTTYIISPKAMISTQITGRSMPIAVISSLLSGNSIAGPISSGTRTADVPAAACRRRPQADARRGRGPLRHQLDQVADAGAEHGHIHHDEQVER